MGETFKAFIAFISEDPIMLGLCIAIVVLIIMFILVLVLGKKKDKKVETTTDTNDELLKTEINMEVLKSTNEYKLDEFKDALQTQEEVLTEENTEITSDTAEIPVTTEEPVKIEIEDKSEVQDNLEVDTLSSELEHTETQEEPSITEYPTFDNIQIAENQDNEETTAPQEEDLNNLSILESSEVPVEENPSIFDTEEKLDTIEDEQITLDDQNVLESTTNPIEIDEVEEQQPVQETVFPIITEENMIKEETPNENSDQVETLSTEETKEEQPIIEEDSPLDISNITLEDDVLITTPTVEEQIPPIKEFTPETHEEIPVEKSIEEQPIEATPEEHNILSVELEPIPDEDNVEQTEDSPTEVTPADLEPISEPEVELPTMTPEEEDVELPDYSDIYSIDDIELPIINFDEFNKTSIPEEKTTEPTEEDDNDDDDLALPKLNTNPSSSISSLQGESFKIE